MEIKKRMDKVRKAITDDNQVQAPFDANAIILGHFLDGYIPVDSFGPGTLIMTTNDIISALGDMADLDQADVNCVLVDIGFVPGRNNNGSFGWMMKRIEH